MERLLNGQVLPWPRVQAPQAMPNDEISAWVLAARAGSQRAFTQLYRRHLPLVHVILLGRYRRAVAEELAQECFVRAFENLAQLQNPHQFGPWIATIARRMRDQSGGTNDVDAELLQQLADASASPVDQAEASQLIRTIYGLPEAFREPLLLRLVEGLDGAEIAQLLGMTPGSVRVNLHRGMSKLRAALGLSAAQEAS